MATTLLAAFVVISLGACGKKKTSSATSATPAAATPGSACIFNVQQNQYLNSSNQVCNPNATQTITCPASGVYTNQYSLQVACTPGQVINTGGYVYPGQYGGGYQNQTGGCDAYYYQYGTWYVPAVVSGQLMCVRYDLVNNQAIQQTPYYNNLDYYYAYPPTYQDTGSGICLGYNSLSFCW